MSTHVSRRRLLSSHRPIAVALAALAALITLSLVAEAAEAAKRGARVKVMTRNVYLGSGLDARFASSLEELCDEAGETIREVDSTKPPARMRAIAREILNTRPDLVGLQEVAAWYIQRPGDGRPPEVVGGAGTPATTARYDFLTLIMKRLNRGPGRRYAVVEVGREFEFESETNLDGLPTDSPNSTASDCNDAEVDGRFLTRDVILKRLHAGVRTRRARSDNFDNLLRLQLLGAIPYDVDRGWEAVNARVRGSRRFVFVNTHLEAFDSDPTNNEMHNTETGTTTTVSRGTVRKTQAQELVGPGGPAGTRRPTILLGDLNSNVPPVQPGDEQAFQAVRAAGFKRRSTQRPPSCCIDDPTGTLMGGSLADFDHVVDHILANKRAIRRLRSGVVGRAKTAAGPRWPSDHAGVWSILRVPRR